MRSTLLILVFYYCLQTYSQNCNSINIQWQADIASTCPFMVMSMLHDQLGRPYLYIANKEAGLTIYDISNISSPTLVTSIDPIQYDTLDVMSVSQNGNYLYLALGNSFSTSQESGMAIVDVNNPATAFVTDYWKLPSSSGGSGIVEVESNYAYLGAMGNGLVILDITNKSNISFVSQYIPSLYFPDPIPDPAKINARGMKVKNSIVYLCYDAGGLRIIDCTNKSNPVETGQYSNPLLDGKPRAYNNIILDDTLIYITFDYCGLEVLNISDTSNISLVGWWNPYNCPNNNWFSSPVHANEIRYNKNCKQIFLSTGKSDMIVLDVSNPSLPDSCNYYGGVSNSMGTWGIDVYQNKIFLSYICALIPFYSYWTGVKILSYDTCSAAGLDEIDLYKFLVYPNPIDEQFIIRCPEYKVQNFEIVDVFGKSVLSQILSTEVETLNINLQSQANGIYFLKVKINDKYYSTKIVKY